MNLGQANRSVSGDSDEVIAQKKRAALDLILDAWALGQEHGIDGEIIAHAALFAAISDMIDIYGEEAVAKLTERLPQRVMDGEFTLARNIQ